MSKKILAWDLGTGGNKASLYSSEGVCLAETFVDYQTSYPQSGWHEQAPEDWWTAVVQSTKELMKSSNTDPSDIACCGISGHSLGVVPIGKDGSLLREQTPIWSDSRADVEADKFFEDFDEDEWYARTGAGFPPPLYSVFKILWYKNNEPELFAQIDKVIGTKDYVNYKLTGRLVTDPSYASGCGVYNLTDWAYDTEIIEKSGLSIDIFPEVVPSTEIIGEISAEIAAEIGLNAGTPISAGGVDNSCMALGALAYKNGRVYNSLGSSCWIAVSSDTPLIENKARPYVFAHVVPGMFASALCIASGGTSYRWVKDQLCKDLQMKAESTGENIYALMDAEASSAPVGSNGLLFNPSLAGGMPIDKSANIRGAFVGMDLQHTRADVIRAAMEGVTLGQRICLDKLRELTPIQDEILLVGGGSMSPLWQQIYADGYHSTVTKTNVDQQAAALGAAAVAAVACGLWDNFDPIDKVHNEVTEIKPIEDNALAYDKIVDDFKLVSDQQSDFAISK